MDDDRQRPSGAVYLPQKDWNAYQMWADYRNSIVERDLGYATTLGLDGLRVLASYEHWREDGPAFFERVEHFLSACHERGIRPVVVLFEAPPERPPTEENLHASDPETAFGVHSPSRPEVLQPRDWKGYARSPIHFTRRWAQEFAGDDRLLATEVMNEPGAVRPRRDFVTDALRTVRTEAPDAPLTLGTKDVRFARFYDCEALDGLPGLDAYQFHMNLPERPADAYEYVTEQRALADEIAAEAAEKSDESLTSETTTASKPLWCTEWQRTLEEPPSRFAPNLASLAPTIRTARAEGYLDGDFFWGLMLRPAYLREPREKGRFNGLFHADGAVYSRLDAEALAGRPLGLTTRHALPSSWTGHRYPYPDPAVETGVRSDDRGGSGDGDGDARRSEASDADDRNSKSDGIEARGDDTSYRELRDALVERIRRLLDPRDDQ